MMTMMMNAINYVWLYEPKTENN